MSAFQPISPRAALRLLEDADTGVDCVRLLADLAEAGLIKGYARLQEVSETSGATSEVRDARIDRPMWKRIVAEGKVAEVFGVGSVRLGIDSSDSASVLGIRFDEKSVKAAAVEHGRERQSAVTRRKPVPAATVQEIRSEPIVPPATVAPAATPAKAPRKILAPDVVALSVDDTAEVLGMSRGTVYKLLEEGKLASKKIGGRRLVNADSVRGLLA